MIFRRKKHLEPQSTYSHTEDLFSDENIEKLICRATDDLIDHELQAFYKGKTVIITGGGGTIGSELARQIALCSPNKLIIFDNYENNAFAISQQLKEKHRDELDLEVCIGSVQDGARIDSVFRKFKPQIVFHAAAHKHVPLMEYNDSEAVKNNCFGTFNTVNAAKKYGAERFVLISTDKAQNPTNVMGATKRVCEMIALCEKESDTLFGAVRFGNVLGSNGSVIPTFIRQIKNGGPLTITDKRMTRYFMTVKEAAGLVLKAGMLLSGNELFALDMGDPISIYSLAEKMISIVKTTHNEDIRIIETGIRPGEKLFEEPLINPDKFIRTKESKIYISSDEITDKTEVQRDLELLRDCVKVAEDEANCEIIKRTLKKIVPSFLC